MTGSSPQGIEIVLHPVSDLATAKEMHAALLGVPPQTDESYYVGFEAVDQHIGLVPGGELQGMTSSVTYQTYCSKLVRSSQTTPTPDREGGPAQQRETR